MFLIDNDIPITRVRTNSTTFNESDQKKFTEEQMAELIN